MDVLGRLSSVPRVRRNLADDRSGQELGVGKFGEISA